MVHTRKRPKGHAHRQPILSSIVFSGTGIEAHLQHDMEEPGEALEAVDTCLSTSPEAHLQHGVKDVATQCWPYHRVEDVMRDLLSAVQAWESGCTHVVPKSITIIRWYLKQDKDDILFPELSKDMFKRHVTTDERGNNNV
jgi:hypothetical protein